MTSPNQEGKEQVEKARATKSIGLRAFLLTLGLAAFLIGATQFFRLAIDDTSGKDRPQVSATLQESDSGLTLEATVKASGLKSTETVVFLVEALNSRTELSDLVAGAGPRQRDDIPEFRDLSTDFDSPQILHLSRIGGDRNGVVDVQLAIPVSAGLYERLRVSAFLNTPLTEQRRMEADEKRSEVTKLESQLIPVTACIDPTILCGAIGNGQEVTSLASELFRAVDSPTGDELRTAGATYYLEAVSDTGKPTESAVDVLGGTPDAVTQGLGAVDDEIKSAWGAATKTALVRRTQTRQQDFSSVISVVTEADTVPPVYRGVLQGLQCQSLLIQQSIVEPGDVATPPPDLSTCASPAVEENPDTSGDSTPQVTAPASCETPGTSNDKQESIESIVACLAALGEALEDDGGVLAVDDLADRATKWRDSVNRLGQLDAVSMPAYPFNAEDHLAVVLAGIYLQNQLVTERNELIDITRDFQAALKQSQECNAEILESGCVLLLMTDVPRRPVVGLTASQTDGHTTIEVDVKATELGGGDTVGVIIAAGDAPSSAITVATGTIGPDSTGSVSETFHVPLSAEDQYACVVAFIRRSTLIRPDSAQQGSVSRARIQDSDGASANENQDPEDRGGTEPGEDQSAADARTTTTGAPVCASPNPLDGFFELVLPPSTTTTTTTTTAPTSIPPDD